MAASNLGTANASRGAQNRLSKLNPDTTAWQWQGDGSCTSWDGLRRDHELWVEDGDCLVYLYDEGQSRRGPSMRIPYQALFDSNCTSLTAFAVSESDHLSSNSHMRGDSNASGGSNISGTSEAFTGTFDAKKLYLGAPADLPREEAFDWHITTRNFFAWLLGKPLVGTSLSRAMIDLLGRMAIYREGHVDNVGDLLEYADNVGYTDFTGRPDLALAMLTFADEFKLAEPWVDSFSHCVGMHEDLHQCQEYQTLKNVNKALITRAALQMDLHLERSARAVHTIVEVDLSSATLDLPTGARRHLDHFRSFLQSHFIASYGYWPPRAEEFSKGLYASMRSEFANLYNYLADQSSASSESGNEYSIVGILNVQQTIRTLDNSFTFDPLPHSLPLLPDINTSAGHRTQAHWALRTWKAGTKDHKQSAVDIVRNAYLKASNPTDSAVVNSSIVQAYIRFESELSRSFDDQLSFGDARKTRWIMIYQMLQRLTSITQAPTETSNAEAAPYPLCCRVTNLPPWSVNAQSSRLSTVGDIRTPTKAPEVVQADPVSNSQIRSLPVGSASADRNSWLSGAIPEKSHRRSLLIDTRLLDRIDTADYPPSLSIPDRSSSRRSASSQDEIASDSSSDTIPSLRWSQGSPVSISSSHGRVSPMSASSSIYSTDDVPEQKADLPIKDEPLVEDFFADGGDFICPGLTS